MEQSRYCVSHLKTTRTIPRTKMNKVLLHIILLIFNSTILICQNIDVYDFPGNENSYLKMTRHPGKTDIEKLSVCLR